MIYKTNLLQLHVFNKMNAFATLERGSLPRTTGFLLAKLMMLGSGDIYRRIITFNGYHITFYVTKIKF